MTGLAGWRASSTAWSPQCDACAARPPAARCGQREFVASLVGRADLALRVGRCRRDRRLRAGPPYLHPPVTTSVGGGACGVVVGLVWAWLSLLPVPGSCR